MDIAEFLTARYDEQTARLEWILACREGDQKFDGGWDLWGDYGRAINTAFDPALMLREIEAKRRILELHTTGSYRTYRCSNGDHIQEWQCERAKEPYTEHRYCEVCGHDCVELPLLATLFSDHPDYKLTWAPKRSA